MYYFFHLIILYNISYFLKHSTQKNYTEKLIFFIKTEQYLACRPYQIYMKIFYYSFFDMEVQTCERRTNDEKTSTYDDTQTLAHIDICSIHSYLAHIFQTVVHTLTRGISQITALRLNSILFFTLSNYYCKAASIR